MCLLEDGRGQGGEGRHDDDENAIIHDCSYSPERPDVPCRTQAVIGRLEREADRQSSLMMSCQVVLKFHRLGRTSFRAVKNVRH